MPHSESTPRDRTPVGSKVKKSTLGLGAGAYSYETDPRIAEANRMAFNNMHERWLVFLSSVHGPVDLVKFTTA